MHQTAREVLIAAAESLTRRGVVPFSPSELIEEARAKGSTHAEMTLRTHISSHMCVNAPTHLYDDFEKVSRGNYRLAKFQQGPVERALRAPLDNPDWLDDATVADRSREWFWEGNVQAAVVRFLDAEGWSIRRVANTASREQGVDIEAELDGKRLLVEVKGYPSNTYSRGDRQGEAKPTQVATQARMYFSHALLAGLLMRSEHEEAYVVLAFPDMTTFSKLGGRVARPLAAARVSIWLVDEHGDVVALLAL